MDCTKIQEQMLNEMGAHATADLSAHLSTCTDCAKLWQAMQASSAALDEWNAPEPSPYFNTRFQARLSELKREEAAPRGAFAWLKQSIWRPALAGALTLAVAVGIGLYERPAGSASGGSPQVSAAVNDLQKLDKDEDLYADFEMLDDLQTDGQQPKATPATSDSKTEL
jgi:anti-sigma factor RsiW